MAEQMDSAFVAIRAPLDALRKDLAKAKSVMDAAVKQTREAIINADPSGALVAADKVEGAMSAIPDGEVDITADASQIDAVGSTISGLPDSHEVTTNADTGDLDGVRSAIGGLPDSHEVAVDVDTSKVDSAASDIKSMLGGAVAGLTAAAAVASFSSLEDAIVGTQVAVGGLVDESVDFEAVLRGIPSYLGAFNETQPVVRDIVSGMQGIAGVDLSTTGITDLATQALTLSRTLDVDVNEAIGAVTAMLTNKLVPDAQTAFDMIYTSSKQVSGPARDELVSALTEYSTFFSVLGLNGSEAMNMIMAASDGSIQSIDKAGDAVKEFGIRAIDGSKASGDAFAAAGLNAEEMGRKIAEGGPTARAAFAETIDAILGINDPLAQNAAAVGLFGTSIEDLGGTTGLEKLRSGLEATTAPVASLKDDSAELAGTFSGEMATAMTTVSNVLASVGEKIAPLVGWFNSLPGPVQVVAIGAGLLTAGLFALAAVFGPLIAGMMGASAAGATLSLSLSPILVPLGLIVLAVAAVIGIGVLLVKNWDTITVAVSVAWGMVTDTIGAAVNFITENIGTMMRVVLGIMTLGGSEIVGYVVRNWDQIQEKIAAAWEFIKGAISLGIETAKSWIGSGLQWISDAWSNAWNAVGDFLSESWTRFTDTVRTGAEGIVSFITELPGRILGAFGDIGRLLIDVGKKMIGGLVDGIKAAIGDVGSAIGSGIKAIGSFLNPFGDGPGGPTAPRGGKALDRVKSIIGAYPGLRITSTYRSPSRNRAAGGSATSYHMDAANPAVDIGGPTAQLDRFHAALGGGWREKLWRVKGHFYHVHVAHLGGMVESSWPTMAGLRADERPGILQVGETVIPKGQSGGSSRPIIVHVAGSVITERDLARNIGAILKERAYASGRS